MDRVLLVITIVLLTFSSVSLAKSPSSGLVTMKCYIEFLGAYDSIQFTRLQKQEAVHIKKIMQERKFAVGFPRSKQSPYKVHECVKAKQKFKSSRANDLEKRSAK